MQRKSLVYLSWLFLSTSSFAAGCSANGENGSTCSIDCAQGQEALCIPGSGGNDPQCLCTGAAEYLQALKGKRDRVIGAIKKKLLASGTVGPANLVGAPVSTASNVDVRGAINTLLIQYGAVPVTRQITSYVPYERCMRDRGPRGTTGEGDTICLTLKKPVQTSQTTQEILSVGPVEIVALQDIAFDDPVYTDLPKDQIASMIKFQNCSNIPLATASQSMSVTMARSASVALTNTVSNTRSKQASFTFHPEKSPLTIGGQISVSETNTTATAKTDTTSESITQSTTAGIANVKPRSAIALELSAYKIQLDATFRTTLEVDADLPANDWNILRLSQALSKEQRTFQVSGVLRTNNASSAQVLQYNVPFDKSICRDDSALTTVLNFTPKKSDSVVLIEAK